MSKNSKALKIAKGLLLLSFNDEGRAEQQRVEEVISELRKEGVSKSLPILKHYLTLMKRKINSYQGVLETSTNENSTLSKILSEKLPKARGNKVDLVLEKNEPLIAGFKLRIGDDVYEDSLSSRISRLKKSLT
jgi:F-type H+-transporting ATPase subunit delta